ncbi:MAG: mannose-1-phosphate guanylyltransferase [Bacteroidales bacterium]|nr:mannose-1-phosphate guanylyltransferase [Bacteroidales bacterium]
MNQNYCIIMAGGIGSRFWPISRTNMPKQFIDILGTGKTLIQETYNRFIKIIPKENIFVVTNKEYCHIVKEQLPLIPEENILGEPMRRNTAPCILYANIKIALQNPDANIVVTPADHLIINEEQFIEDINEGLKFISLTNSLLTLGITPDRPATGYGYIQLEELNNDSRFVNVKTFTEKPHLELAKFFIKSGDFLWNSGIFLWKNKVIDNAFKEFLPELYDLFYENINYFGTKEEQTVINRIYSDAKSISIDFGVMEKAQNVYVLKTDFGWSDLGTWNSLYSLKEKDENKNVLVSDNIVVNHSSSNYINSTAKDRILVLKDLDDYIVVDTDSVLLICKRENEQQIENLLNESRIKFGDSIK